MKINENEKILKLYPKKGNTFNTYNPKYIIVSNKFTVPKNRIILVALSIPSNSSEFTLDFYYVSSESTQYITLGDGTSVLNINFEECLNTAVRPWTYAEPDLTSYFTAVDKTMRRRELEKTAKELSSKLTELNALKTLAELNPEYEKQYKEYFNLISEEINPNANLALTEGTENKSEE